MGPLPGKEKWKWKKCLRMLKNFLGVLIIVAHNCSRPGGSQRVNFIMGYSNGTMPNPFQMGLLICLFLNFYFLVKNIRFWVTGTQLLDLVETQSFKGKETINFSIRKQIIS